MTSQEVRRPLSRMRAAVVRTVQASAQVPQFNVDVEIDTGALAALRASGVPLSYSDALVAAVARGLRRHPVVNARFDGDAIVENADVNVAFVVGLDDGLVTPAILGADEKSLPELAAERIRLTEAAKNGTLRPEELFSGTFTVSNLGPFGVSRFQAMVLPPQAAILAVGSVRADSRLTLTLSCDHRVVDGVPAARFLADVGELLERPEWLTSSPA
ncbi:2-oxo acid dehydrogenase subunit E2 [Streptosporangium sp. NPDC051022]|uniref:2-oxo acid dehydrogenase subunit E2 n=1 Tax=Streptosporangium sp. NPDC051022 TaxID=3155752 RepID=UPI0034212C31